MDTNNTVVHDVDNVHTTVDDFEANALHEDNVDTRDKKKTQKRKESKET